MQDRSQPSSPHPRGFTLIELLVCISIIATLMSLILPAVQRARASARMVQCRNRLKNLALAQLGYATVHQGSFPGAVHLSGHRRMSWVAPILPYIDAQSIHDHLDTDNPPDVKIKALVCPDDRENRDRSRGLSYVVNVGFGRMSLDCQGSFIHRDTMDWRSDDGTVLTADVGTIGPPDGLDGYGQSYLIVAGNEGGINLRRAYGMDWDQDGTVTQHEDNVTRATGVFWSSSRPTNGEFSINDLDQGDGTTNTLMMSERDFGRDWVDELVDPDAEQQTHMLFQLRFLSTVARYGFGMPSSLFRVGGEHVMPKEGAPWVTRPKTEQLNFSQIIFPRADCPPPNRTITQVVNNRSREFPAVTSAHASGVNAAFCDGRVAFLSEDIDPMVYVKLLTSSGTRYGEPLLRSLSF